MTFRTITRFGVSLALSAGIARSAPLQAQVTPPLLGPLLQQAVPHLFLEETDTLYVDSASLRAAAARLDVPSLSEGELAEVMNRVVVLSRRSDVPRIDERPPTSWRDRLHVVYVHIGRIDLTDTELKLVFTLRGGTFGAVQVTYHLAHGAWIFDRAAIIEIS